MPEFDALRILSEAGELDPLDLAFGEFAARFGGGDAVALAAALASGEVGKGHVCLDLAATVERLEARGLTAPADWRNALAKSDAVAAPGVRAPLVLDGDRLYLHRYWRYETTVADALKRLAAPIPNVPFDRLAAALPAFFPHEDSLDRQALAAVLGVTHRLAIVSGGPGTGKTRTVIRLVALALELDADLNVALAAPTGKAAARLQETLAASDLPGTFAERMPQKAVTIHRLLGYNPDMQRIRYTPEAPLPFDLVVVDEASMVDLGLMARLLAALASDARLVLVGDRDQLASVEAGAVLGDICTAAAGFPGDVADALEPVLGASLPRAAGKVSPLSSSIALLERNYRFGDAGIGALADAVVHGDADHALAALSETRKDLAWYPDATTAALDRELARVVAERFAPGLAAASPQEVLARFAGFRLLAALRRGPFGVEGLNARIEALLAERGLGRRGAAPWYSGRPVLITENDYELQLFNGDLGVVWPDGKSDRLAVWFTTADGTLRSVPPSRLPPHETCYALTVHKAQGSEFDRVALVLPPQETAIATRELLYTGITRARQGVELWASEDALRTAIACRIRRASGLAERLTMGSR